METAVKPPGITVLSNTPGAGTPQLGLVSIKNNLLAMTVGAAMIVI
jgi:hypothetical protein